MGLFDFLKASEFKETIKKLEDENVIWNKN